MKSATVWIFPKWYPNRNDRQIGVFIQKHAQSIAENFSTSVLFIQSSNYISGSIEIETKVNRGVKEIFVYYKQQNSVFLKLFFYWKAFSRGLSVLQTESPDPDVIQSYILLRTGIIAWYLSRRKKIPFIISEQWSGYATGKFTKQNYFKKLLTKYIISKADGVTSVSEFLKSKMLSEKLVNKNFAVIPNIIEEVGLERINSPNENLITVLLVADLVDDIKNISSVIKTAGKLREEANFKLLIVGHGRDEKKLKKLAEDLSLLNSIVFFEGIKTNEEVYQYLFRSDFLVMNSRFETFSLICAEALSCGKPVLATKCGGPNEFVTADTGILIEPDNEEQLAVSFLHMLKNHKKYDRVKIKKHVTDLFSRKIVSEAFKKFIENVLQKKIEE